jgi:hypothetical protein
MMQYRGVLLHAAEARTKPLDETGLAVPVLCLDVELIESPLHNVMHVEQLYEPNEHELVKARAKTLKKGDTVDVLVPLIDIRLVAKNATLITPIASDKAAPTTPTPNPQEPELWPA